MGARECLGGMRCLTWRVCSGLVRLRASPAGTFLGSIAVYGGVRCLRDACCLWDGYGLLAARRLGIDRASASQQRVSHQCAVGARRFSAAQRPAGGIRPADGLGEGDRVYDVVGAGSEPREAAARGPTLAPVQPPPSQGGSPRHQFFQLSRPLEPFSQKLWTALSSRSDTRLPISLIEGLPWSMSASLMDGGAP